ncbi:MAG TPA: ferrous iron transport protein A [Candidatus Merdibacter merdigallinarum]|nr:ferrous iron transport protein A [Candidatus Merdibacter merdigallinarum]
MSTLDSLVPGESGIIVSVGGSGALRHRLLDMGLTPRTAVRVERIAPMGDPMELYLRGYRLTLRKEDASKIEVEKQ